MSTSGGKILCEEAYAQGKMVNSEAWSDLLPRGITPSDADLIFDSNGKILMTELSRTKRRWRDIARGQFILYQNFIMAGRGDIVAALAKHSVHGRAICSVSDIDSFQVMFLHQGMSSPALTSVIDGDRWKEFV